MNAYRQYAYVGPHAIRELLKQSTSRNAIRKPDDILAWISATKPTFGQNNTIVVTFIVDMNQTLWIADQRSEHVVCAAGQDVLSAGEITFAIQDQHIEVTAIANQSTGYCPEPESWPIIEQIFTQLGLSHPSNFTTEFIFRRCNSCRTINIVKDGWFECAVCQAPLSQKWNFDEGEAVR